MITAGTWMMNGYGRGADAVFSRHMGGDFGMFGPMSLVTISILSVIFFLALLWVIAIKGYALWHAAKRNEKWWFVALLVINTFGILELVYVLFFAKAWPRKTNESMMTSCTKGCVGPCAGGKDCHAGKTCEGVGKTCEVEVPKDEKTENSSK